MIMSKIKYYVCDKCGKRIGSIFFGVKRKKIVRISYRTRDPYDYGDFDFELCEKCGNDLWEYLKTPKAQEENK